jgi:nitrogen regulatory protein P-II 1
MKKLEAVIQGCKADQVREALANEKIPRITIFEVKGAGSSQGTLKEYRGAQYIEYSTEIKIEIVVDDDDAERTAQLILNALRSGDLGDGEVIIIPVEQNFRLRVGQHGHPVREWEHNNPVRSYLMRNTTSFRSYLKALTKKSNRAG